MDEAIVDVIGEVVGGGAEVAIVVGVAGEVVFCLGEEGEAADVEFAVLVEGGSLDVFLYDESAI